MFCPCLPGFIPATEESRVHYTVILFPLVSSSLALRTWGLVAQSARTGRSDAGAALREKLLDQLRDAIRIKHPSISTKKPYVHWAKRYILFHNILHPAEIGDLDFEAFLFRLAKDDSWRRWRLGGKTPFLGSGEARTLNQWLKSTKPQKRFSHPMACIF
jgi:hypothetical protein